MVLRIQAMAKRTKKKAWGGARDGAGRPATMDARVTLSVTLGQEHVDRLDAYGEKVGASNRSEALRRLIEETCG